MQMPIYHFYNKGENVICETEEDLVYLWNKVVLFSLRLRIQIMALVVMSTHIHLVAGAYDKDDISELAAKLKRTYSRYHSMKYKVSEVLKKTCWEYKEIENEKALVATMAYVLKNPVHHYIAGYPFAYKLSTAPYYFLENMYGERAQDIIKSRLRRFGDLSIQERRAVDSAGIATDDLMVDENWMISPLSFLPMKLVRKLWGNSAWSFMVDMNTKPKDTDGQIVDDGVLDMRGCWKSDVEICAIIHAWLEKDGVSSIHALTTSKREEYAARLRKDWINEKQIVRCLWL